MKKLLFIALALVFSCSLCNAGMTIQGATISGVAIGGGTATEPTDYSDIIFYSNCDNVSSAAQKSGGTSTITYEAGILSETTSPIVGTGSWDNNNDGYDNIAFETSGNIDFASGRFGFYFQPKELSDGFLVFDNTQADGEGTRNFSIGHSTVDELYFNWQGQSDITSGLDLVADTTYFIEVKFDGTAASLYVDGVLQASVSGGDGSAGKAYMCIFSVDGNAFDSWVDQVISSNDIDRDLNAIKNVTDFS